MRRKKRKRKKARLPSQADGMMQHQPKKHAKIVGMKHRRSRLEVRRQLPDAVGMTPHRRAREHQMKHQGNGLGGMKLRLMLALAG